MELTLKQARRLADKSQRDVANHLGVCVDTYRALERNPEKVTVEQAKKISDYFGMSHNLIFFGNSST